MRTFSVAPTIQLTTLLVAFAMTSVVGCSSCGGASAPDAAGVDEGSAAASEPVPEPVPEGPWHGDTVMTEAAERALRVAASIDPAPDVIRVRVAEIAAAEYEQSTEEMRELCMGESPDLCLPAGAKAFDGTGEGVAEMIEVWTHGCDAGSAACCDWLASFLVAVGSAEQVATTLGPICDAGRDAACFAAAWATLDDVASSTRTVLDLRCNEGEGRACRLRASAWIAQGDRDTARQTLLEGCALEDDPSCLGAVAIDLLNGVQPNDEIEGELGRLCEFRYRDACTLVGALALPRDADPQAVRDNVVPVWREACTGGDPVACRELGLTLIDAVPVPSAELLAEGSGDSVDPSVVAYQAAVDEATPWLVTACNLGEGVACWRMVAVLRARGVGEGEVYLERELMRRACEGGVDEGCEAPGVASPE